ncbi:MULTISPECIES: BLUF domain-containing protein [Sphingobium]|uniref:BLUF domain-containing protein n=1 Tax=Sphingobium tyrosinilyticum TaxID=2715436 RepID=A0ABV9EXU0_9SPHN|nr:BLUF domain-containing protein [Sphingobium sp. EP60837]ANI79516.1 Photoactivated adenylate cyclase subunit alpha [Sphingobium sp. EP60837]
MFRWFYISASRLVDDEADEVVCDIVNVSVARNRALGVTGALLFTGRNFAQYLEGPPRGVDQLRQSICLDMRHENIRTIAEGEYSHRRFVTWSLAYLPPPQLLSSRAEELLIAAEHDGEANVEALAQFLCEMTVKGRG